MTAAAKLRGGAATPEAVLDSPTIPLGNICFEGCGFQLHQSFADHWLVLALSPFYGHHADQRSAPGLPLRAGQVEARDSGHESCLPCSQQCSRCMTQGVAVPTIELFNRQPEIS